MDSISITGMSYEQQFWPIVQRLEDSHPSLQGLITHVEVQPNTWGEGKSPFVAFSKTGRITFAPAVVELYQLLRQNPTLDAQQRLAAEYVWSRFIPQRIADVDACASENDLTAPDQALLTVLFFERFPHAGLGRYNPSQMEIQTRAIKQDELLQMAHGSYLTHYLIPDENALNAYLIHETGHLRDKHEDDYSVLLARLLQARPEIAQRYPTVKENRPPAVSRKPLAVPLLLAGVALLAASSPIVRIAGVCFSVYLGVLYRKAKRLYLADVFANVKRAIHEWKETEADLNVVNHGNEAEKTAYRRGLNHTYVTVTLEHIGRYRTLSTRKVSLCERLVRCVLRCHDLFQDIVYRFVIGSKMPKRETSTFQEYYDRQWRHVPHIEPYKRLQKWDKAIEEQRRLNAST